ncbi:DUF6221 family protein [Streptomyces sp. NPDC056543]|uniref:DUF6221 family protein n=1 Tax=unclassified Streptomyces TaxID=2593676 RepID=UPI0036C70CF0
MDDLVQFLRARLDEDEQTARGTAMEWGTAWTVDEAMTSVRSDTGADVVAEPNVPIRHIASHDPARVLREVDAKRRRLEVLADAIQRGHDDYDIATELLPLEALPYADHPDYRDEWRP